MSYIIDHIPKSKDKRSGTKANMTSITIHNTGNPRSTARNERGWLTNPENNRAASFHIVVDDKEAIECIPLDEVAYHAGNAEGNRSSIGIEVCESGDQQRTWENAVALVVRLLIERGWGIANVRTHKSWSGKDCPRLLLPRWTELLTDIEQGIKALSEASPDASEVEAWKLEGLKYLAEKRLISDPPLWTGKIDEAMPVWAAMIIMANIHRDLKEGKQDA